jgi:hypothetical protein
LEVRELEEDKALKIKNAIRISLSRVPKERMALNLWGFSAIFFDELVETECKVFCSILRYEAETADTVCQVKVLMH